MKQYPLLKIDCKKLGENVERIMQLCREYGIQAAGVSKGFNSIPELCQVLWEHGCEEIASSRMYQLKELKLRFPQMKTMLIRIPMMTELAEAVRYADSILISEEKTLRELNRLAGRAGTIKSVILMSDLGDLREGIMSQEDMIRTARFVEEEMKSLYLKGIGTNLSCYGSVLPTAKNLSQLIAAAERVEEKLGRKLEIISGGATTTIPLLLSDGVPKRINHLRLGECMFCAPLSWKGMDISGMSRDVFTLEAEIVELNSKPTLPIGERGVAAFGKEKEYVDRGVRRRAIAAVGNQDLGDATGLLPTARGVQILGASGDHMILDIEDSSHHWHVGDIATFQMVYQTIIYATMSQGVSKELMNLR